MITSGVVVKQWSDPWHPGRAPEPCRMCSTAASWLVWTDETNADGEGSDMDGYPACHEHLADVVTIKIMARPVIPAQPGTKCQWRSGHLTCRGGAKGEPGTVEVYGTPGDAVHVLCVTLPIGDAGTALCAFHSPYDVKR